MSSLENVIKKIGEDIKALENNAPLNLGDLEFITESNSPFEKEGYSVHQNYVGFLKLPNGAFVDCKMPIFIPDLNLKTYNHFICAGANDNELFLLIRSEPFTDEQLREKLTSDWEIHDIENVHSYFENSETLNKYTKFKLLVNPNFRLQDEHIQNRFIGDVTVHEDSILLNLKEDVQYQHETLLGRPDSWWA